MLDLDETLVHSSLDTAGQADFSFPVTISNNTHVVNVRMRPYLREFLEVVSTMYEVVIFTASQRVYAEQLLNIIDNNKQLIRYGDGDVHEGGAPTWYFYCVRAGRRVVFVVSLLLLIFLFFFSSNSVYHYHHHYYHHPQ